MKCKTLIKNKTFNKLNKEEMKKNIFISLDNISCFDTTFYENHISIYAIVKDNECYLLYLINRNKYEQYIKYIIEGEIRKLISKFTWKQILNKDPNFIYEMNEMNENINNKLKYFNLNLKDLSITKIHSKETKNFV